MASFATGWALGNRGNAARDGLAELEAAALNVYLNRRSPLHYNEEEWGTA